MNEYLFNLSVFIGIAGLIFLIIALLAGLKIIKIKSSFKRHKQIALIGSGAVVIHALVMLYFYFFI